MALEQLDYDYNVFNPAQAQADSNLAVRFYMQPLQDFVKSEDAGRPIFVDPTMIEIRVRGDRNNIVQRPLREDDKKRFRDAWRNWEDGNKQVLTGTPLAQWPIMSASMVEEMRYFGFFTVEQLADANEGVLGRVPGMLSMKQKAQAFLEFSKGAAPLEKLQSALDQEKAARVVAEQNNSALASRVDELETKYRAILEAHAHEASAKVTPVKR